MSVDHARNILYQAVDLQLSAQMDLEAVRLYLADLCDLSPTAYQSARQVYGQGTLELMQAVHQERIPLWLAEKISTLAEIEQKQKLTEYFEFQADQLAKACR